jgi:integrase
VRSVQLTAIATPFLVGAAPLIRSIHALAPCGLPDPFVHAGRRRRCTSCARGLPHVPFHNLRHGTATLLLAAGVADRVVVEIMGHADTRILRRYQDVVPELLREAATKLSALLVE